MSVSSLSEAYLYPDAPVLDHHELATKFADWSSGITVTSDVPVVGYIPAPPQIEEMFATSAMAGRGYNNVGSGGPFYEQTASLRESLLSLARADLARAKLCGRISLATYAGIYEEEIDGGIHVDNYTSQVVRWTVAHGLPGTIGVLGKVSQADLVDDGELPQALNGDYKYIHPGEGEVARFTCSDIHGGCQRDGPRILTVATWRLPYEI